MWRRDGTAEKMVAMAAVMETTLLLVCGGHGGAQVVALRTARGWHFAVVVAVRDFRQVVEVRT